MSDDWGCNVELFGESNSTQKPSKSLTELVDILTKKNKNGSKQNVQTAVEAENVKIFPFSRNGSASSSTVKIAKVHAPKILKKKKPTANNNNNNKVLNETNVKRVTFEIEQLLSREAAKDDRDKARERILASLGAGPAKRAYTNYKDLKAERAAQKSEAKAQSEMNHGNNLLMTMIKKKKKKK